MLLGCGGDWQVRIRRVRAISRSWLAARMCDAELAVARRLPVGVAWRGDAAAADPRRRPRLRRRRRRRRRAAGSSRSSPPGALAARRARPAAAAVRPRGRGARAAAGGAAAAPDDATGADAAARPRRARVNGAADALLEEAASLARSYVNCSGYVPAFATRRAHAARAARECERRGRGVRVRAVGRFR